MNSQNNLLNQINKAAPKSALGAKKEWNNAFNAFIKSKVNTLIQTVDVTDGLVEFEPFVIPKGAYCLNMGVMVSDNITINPNMYNGTVFPMCSITNIPVPSGQTQWTAEQISAISGSIYTSGEDFNTASLDANYGSQGDVYTNAPGSTNSPDLQPIVGLNNVETRAQLNVSGSTDYPIVIPKSVSNSVLTFYWNSSTLGARQYVYPLLSAARLSTSQHIGFDGYHKQSSQWFLNSGETEKYYMKFSLIKPGIINMSSPSNKGNYPTTKTLFAKMQDGGPNTDLDLKAAGIFLNNQYDLVSPQELLPGGKVTAFLEYKYNY